MTESSSSKKWFPLEANPEVMTSYTRTLGVENGCFFTDIFGLDDELLAMVPQPVLAVVMLFPMTKENDAAVDQLHAIAAASGAAPATPGPFFMHQTVSNACGTVGLVHAVANNTDRVQFRAGSVVQRFVEATKSSTPAERALWFENDTELDKAQAEAAQQGQTSNQDLDANINLHFICLVAVGGTLYELDGRKPAPLALGECDEASLLKRAAARAQEYMALNPDEVNFTLAAMCAE
jgi:ubiquitin carboxyl-terminal hydrolase L3